MASDHWEVAVHLRGVGKCTCAMCVAHVMAGETPEHDKPCTTESPYGRYHPTELAEARALVAAKGQKSKPKPKFQVGQVWECRNPRMGLRRIDAVGERLTCSIFAPGMLDHGKRVGTKDLDGSDYAPGNETPWDLVRLVHDYHAEAEALPKVRKGSIMHINITLSDPSIERDLLHEPQSAFRAPPYDHFPDLEGWTMQKG